MPSTPFRIGTCVPVAAVLYPQSRDRYRPVPDECRGGIGHRVGDQRCPRPTVPGSTGAVPTTATFPVTQGSHSSPTPTSTAPTSSTTRRMTGHRSLPPHTTETSPGSSTPAPTASLASPCTQPPSAPRSPVPRPPRSPAPPLPTAPTRPEPPVLLPRPPPLRQRQHRQRLPRAPPASRQPGPASSRVTSAVVHACAPRCTCPEPLVAAPSQLPSVKQINVDKLWRYECDVSKRDVISRCSSSLGEGAPSRRCWFTPLLASCRRSRWAENPLRGAAGRLALGHTSRSGNRRAQSCRLRPLREPDAAPIPPADRR